MAGFIDRQYVEQEVNRHEQKISHGWMRKNVGDFYLRGTRGDVHVWWEWSDSYGFYIQCYSSSRNEWDRWYLDIVA